MDCIFVEQDAIARSVSHEPPTHFTVEIQSFSCLAKNVIDKYESREFEAGKYKWKLIIHPKGNNKENVKEHISVYLAITNTGSFNFSWEVYALFRLFLLDQKKDKFLILQDAVGKERRFHRMKLEWGFDEFIPLKEFNDPSSGYLVEDTCIFGAEVFVKEKNICKRECLSMVKNRCSVKLVWKIQNFSKLKSRFFLHSEVFSAGNHKWRLRLYPTGGYNPGNNHLSLFLALADPKTSDRIYAGFTLRIFDQVSAKRHQNLEDKHWFSASSCTWGSSTFIALSDLNEPGNGFLVEDVCVVEAEVTVLGISEQLVTNDDPNSEIGPSVSANEFSDLGAGLRNEALNYFLDMIIEILWHLREYPEEFMNRSKLHHKHINNSCIVCELKEIFEKNSWRGQMDNASAILSIILESLHDLLISDLKLDKKISMNCFVAERLVHRIYGMDHHERIHCVKCKVEWMHQNYSFLYLSLSAENLRTKKDKQGEKFSDEVLKLEMNKQWLCKDCRQINNVYHTFRCLPNVFTIVLIWKKHDESEEGISRILNTLSTDLDLSVLFQRCEPDSKYFLVSMVCFSGTQEQYIRFVYKHELEKYVLYREKYVEIIGSWKEVLDICVKVCWQPTILFFHPKSRCNLVIR